MKLECQNCGMVGDEEEFPQAKDVHLRHEPGDTFSDQECPDCGALAFPHITDAEQALNRIKAIVGIDDELESAIAKLAKAMGLLESAVEHWAGRFGTEEDINGADCVDWLADFIEQAEEITKKGG